MPRPTAEEIIIENKRFIEENQIKSWDEFHKKVIELRLANARNQNKETN